MTFSGWLIFILVIQVIHFLGTYKLYQKAGRKAWEALVPVYNAVILMKIINRPTWWVILLFLPIINLIMFPVVWVETIRSFGKNSSLDTWLVILTLGLYIFYVNYAAPDVVYIKDRSLKPKSVAGEWVSSILFAVVAATIVHTYVMQPFVIPSSSLEKTLLIGDFLFVSKFHYGARVPMTTVAAPMVHDTIPVLGVKSYLFNDHYEERNTSWINKLQLPYMRIPGFESIERNDIVVFNQPADTLLDMNNFHPARNYYKPIDKKTNLVKRCVAIPGDTLEVRDGHVYIDGKKSVLPDRAKPQFNYFVDTEGQQISQEMLVNYGARDGAKYRGTNEFAMDTKGRYFLTLTEEEAERIKKHPVVKSVTKNFEPADYDVFPRIDSLKWTMDNYGPLYIPKKGDNLKLTEANLPFYKRLITEYEGNNLTTVGNTIFINGKETNTYHVKQNYYWMMGDNRQNSLDARKWGFVPFSHVVGKPVFIWMSIEQNASGLKKIRWNRMFTTVGGSGEPRSYLLFAVIVGVLIYFGNKFYQKKKNKK